MDNVQVYIKPGRSIEVTKADVRIADIASVFCTDKGIQAKVKHIKLHHFKEGHDMRCIISVMEIIALIQSQYPDVEIVNVGETDTIIRKAKPQDSSLMKLLKIVFVSAICFFGASFTIMAFHNDIGIVQVFSRIYKLLLGVESTGFGMLEIGYSFFLPALDHDSAQADSCGKRKRRAQCNAHRRR